MDTPVAAPLLRAAAAAFLAAAAFASEAEPAAAKPDRIGVLGRSEPPAANLAAFRAGMRDRGHVEGKTYVLVPGWEKPGGKRQRYAVLAKRLVGRGVDVIVALSSSATRAAKRTAPSTPIVIAQSADPVGAGLVQSLAEPGGNVTGMSTVGAHTVLKGFETLTLLVPGARRIAVISDTPRSLSGLRGRLWGPVNRRAAEGLGIDVVDFARRDKETYEALFARVTAAGVDAISIRSTTALSTAQRKRLLRAALEAKLPSVSTRKAMVKLGQLASYGPDFPWIFRRVAAYVDLILKGAKPAALPVEQVSRFDLTINLRTARALGIAVPPVLLLRADEVIQ